MNPTSKNKITGFSLLSPNSHNKNKDTFSVNATYHASIEFIQRAGIAIKLPIKTINSAIMIFLRYFASNDINNENMEYSINDICRCSLFSASKIEETPCRLRDIMNATYKITFGDIPLPNPNTTEWHKWKDCLIKLESIILNQINFEFNAVSPIFILIMPYAIQTKQTTQVHPHQFVLHQCNELKTNTNIAKLAWSICNDCMYSRDIMLSFEPHQISAAAIYIASEFLLNAIHLTVSEGENESNNSSNSSTATSPLYRSFSNNSSSALSPQSFDGTKEPNWWRRFDIDDDNIRHICMLIMDLYESPFAKFEDEEKERVKKMEMSAGDEDIDLKEKLKTPSPINGNKKNGMDMNDDEDDNMRL